ncbi:hypothetical protein KY317_02305 [Candidatus Woesearchaeota archaeon]|nr:hypothetical protein [Candidatus Woesearchaeota archaeon]
MAEKEDISGLLAKYKERLGKELNANPEKFLEPVFSREYKQFKREYYPKPLSFYEKACRFCEKILKISPSKKNIGAVKEAIKICHLDITPEGSTSLAIITSVFMIIFGALLFIVFGSLFFMMFFLVAGLASIFILGKMPIYIANNWRIKASNQMVLCVFYVVTYMRHTSNLEAAIRFASEHLEPPLSLDLRKVLWDVETGHYESIKESLDFYLETWRKYNMEFMESLHLIESSLYEPSESRRLDLLDRALDVILTETYEKMLHYAHNLKNPITMLHMLGIILPILGLVILPLIVNFMGEIRWYYIAALYNVILPVTVYLLGISILSKRPTGYGDTDISETNPAIKKQRSVLFRIGKKDVKVNPFAISCVVFAVLLIIGLSPVIMHVIDSEFDTQIFGTFKLLDYRESKAIEGPNVGKIIGPYGLGSAVLSLFVVLGVGLSLGLYFTLRSKNVIKIRKKTKELEDEFASALFQLGNRLGDGLPAEIAVGKVAEVMTDTTSGNFFRIVSMNISRLGMSVQDAIFNPRTGALVYFPSRVIESSMKVLTQSIRKGPKVAAQALMNIARYIKEIHKVNERLKDLMADIIASMKSQISFLTPAIAGIVIGITSMVTTILGRLSIQMSQLVVAGEEISTMQSGFLGSLGDGIPTFYFQIIVGIYVVQIIYLLTVLSNGIENGSDKLAERYSLGKNLIRSTLLYVFVAFVVMVLFNIIASQIMMATMS